MEYPALVLQLSKGAITLQEAYGEVARHITDTVGCTRASLWLFTAGGTTIELQALIDTRTGEISQGDTLHEDDYPDYFSAITNNLRVIATEARSHPATECLSEDYLQPLDIVSLLDFVVLHNGHPAAILSCEHCGEQKPMDRRRCGVPGSDGSRVLRNISLRRKPIVGKIGQSAVKPPSGIMIPAQKSPVRTVRTGLFSFCVYGLRGVSFGRSSPRGCGRWQPVFGRPTCRLPRGDRRLSTRTSYGAPR